MKLVSNWQQAWRLNSVQAAAALAFLSALQANVLPQVQSLLPAAWWPWISGGVALLIILLRLRDQQSGALITLVSNWQQAWRLNSVQAAAALAFLSALQANVLPQIQGLVPAAWWPWITGTVALLIILLRLRDQPDVSVGTAAATADASEATE